jgi:mono/diheme cytochrome c family protein
MTPARVLAVAALTVAVAGCAEPEPDPLAERGRQVYLSQCMACHGPDPARDGPLGPAVTGASPALLEAKVLHGEYPAGYVPKRPSRVMQPMPALEPDIPALAAYLE